LAIIGRVSVKAKDQLEALFKFRMPMLPTGDYSICVAVAEGAEGVLPASLDT
jgi:hypothetical protein